MKLLRSISTIGLVLVCGCACDVRTATRHRTLDIGTAPGPRGYVEFYAATNNAIIPIYRINNDGTARLMSAVGLEAGDRYHFDPAGAVVAERLTVAAPPGERQFRVENGPLINVNVVEGKTISVPIDYKLLDKSEHFVIYAADARGLESSSARKEK